jgi:hypothetical protein
MEAVEEFLERAILVANGGRPYIYEDGVDPRSMLPWGDAPGPRDIVHRHRPDRPDEPWAWTAREWSLDGTVLWGQGLQVKKVFVEDCLVGSVLGMDIQHLFGTLVDLLWADNAVVV